MAIAIIVGVLLLAIAPLMWVLPSRRERELATLREAARRLGYTLQVTEVDHPSPAAEEQVSASGRKRRPMLPCVAYRLPRQAGSTSVLARAGAAVGDADELDPAPEDSGILSAPRTRITRRVGSRQPGLPDDWRVDDGFERPDPVLQALLPTLGPDLLAMESTGSTVAVFWTERGGLPRLTEITALLRALMRDQPPR